MNKKTAIAATAAGVILLGGALIWVISSASSGDEAGATPAPTATLADIPDGVTAVDQKGQAAEGGTFEPLAIPAGITSGIGMDIPEDQMTQPGSDLGVGDLIITNLYQSDAAANPYVLLTVDEISDPLTDAARADAFSGAGMPDDGSRNVQRVTLRLRQIAGSGDMANWNLIRSVAPINLSLESMTVIDIPSAACGSTKTPLAGHDGTTNDTVQSCFYAFGSVNTPASPISSLTIAVRMGGQTERLFIQSNAGLDLGVGDAHAADHDHEWYQTDPETGVPLVDPETGKVIPKEGHEDHGH